MTSPPIRDDTLRLLLSKGHEAWLTEELRYHRFCLTVSATLLALGVAAPVIVALLPVLGAFGVSLGGVAALSLVLSPAWFAIVCMSLIDLRKVRRWRDDHQAFLSKYNRV
ncbi:MAG: hypothetical protein RIC16_10755 [Rhodospirillales bacterium]